MILKKEQLTKKLDNVLHKILEVITPEKIILFGSAAKNEMHENSDFDLLIITENGVSKRKVMHRIYENFIGVGFAVDIVMASVDDIQMHKNNPSFVYKIALSEGKVIYE